MICYKDRTFCSSDCVNTKCFRYFGQQEREGSQKWAELMELDYAPIAWSDYSDSCPLYERP